MTRHYLLITLQLLLVIYIKLLLLLKAIMHASLLLGNGLMILFPYPTAMKHVMWPLMNHYGDCGVIESKLVVNEYCCYYMS